jgi:hypothetical protein
MMEQRRIRRQEIGTVNQDKTRERGRQEIWEVRGEYRHIKYAKSGDGGRS